MATDPGAIGSHIVAATAASTTRAGQQARLTHFLESILGYTDPNDPIRLCFTHHGITQFGDVMALDHATIDSLNYPDPNPADPNNVQTIHLNLGTQGAIKAYIALVHDHSHRLGARIDSSTLTIHDYNNFRIGAYNPNVPIVPFVSANPTPTPASTSTTSASTLTAAEKFSRAIKKDVDHYPTLKDKKAWNTFRRAVESTAANHGTSNVLDSNYTPPNDPAGAEERALFKVQQTFMYDVLNKKLMTDIGQTHVRRYADTKDAQKVWKDTVNFYEQSIAGKIMTDDLVLAINSARIEEWTGSQNGFILWWSKQLRLLKQMTPSTTHMKPKVKMNLL